MLLAQVAHAGAVNCSSAPRTCRNLPPGARCRSSTCRSAPPTPSYTTSTQPSACPPAAAAAAPRCCRRRSASCLSSASTSCTRVPQRLHGDEETLSLRPGLVSQGALRKTRGTCLRGPVDDGEAPAVLGCRRQPQAPQRLRLALVPANGHHVAARQQRHLHRKVPRPACARQQPATAASPTAEPPSCTVQPAQARRTPPWLHTCRSGDGHHLARLDLGHALRAPAEQVPHATLTSSDWKGSVLRAACRRSRRSGAGGIPHLERADGRHARQREHRAFGPLCRPRRSRRQRQRRG